MDSFSDRTYWAAAAPEDIGDELSKKCDEYYAFLTSSSLVDLFRKSFYAFYGLFPETAVQGMGLFAIGSLIAGGSEGEIVRMKVNHYRNLILHQLSLTTSQRPALECRALNSDSASLAQAYLGDGILDYYVREKGLERHFDRATEIALVMGEGWIRCDWDATAGKEYGQGPNGTVLHDGDIVVKTYNPFDVVRDTTVQCADDLNWWICHDLKNRFDLAAKYPALADEILATSTDVTSGRRFIDPTKIIPSSGIGSRHTELIDIYEFLHVPTDALPEGRYTIFLNGGITLFDGPLPFRHVPLHRIAASNIIGAPFGWTLAFDLIGIQEIIDKLYTVVASNQMATGLQNFWQPPGNNLSKTNISGGLNLLESVVKPEVLQMCSTPPEIFSFITKLEGVMETLSGVSAVNRGATPENLKSGSALAFVAAQAVEFSSDLQASYNGTLEGVGTTIINILKDYAATPRMATIAGSFNRPLMKEYVGNDLTQIDRVVVDAVAATSKTTAGKIQIAQDLLQAGLIKNPQEYLTIINTGELDPLFESEMSQILLVRAENEDLRAGKMPMVIILDDPVLHVLEHASLLANPDSRRDPNLVGNADQTKGPLTGVLGHIQEHINVAQQRTPALLALLKQAPLPQPMPPQPSPQSPGQPQVRPGQMGAGPTGMPAQLNPVPPQLQQAEAIKSPNMPNLPPGAPEGTEAAYEQMKAGLPRA